MNQMVEGTSEEERLLIGVREAFPQASSLSNVQPHANKPSLRQFESLDDRPLDAA